MESLRYCSPLSADKPLTIFKYAFQQPRSEGSRREPWERGWSFSYAELGDNRNSRTRFLDSRGWRKNKLRENETRGFSYPFPRSPLEAWARQFLKVRVTFQSLNKTVKSKANVLISYPDFTQPRRQGAFPTPPPKPGKSALWTRLSLHSVLRCTRLAK